jgi:hypothetical protein
VGRRLGRAHLPRAATARPTLAEREGDVHHGRPPTADGRADDPKHIGA